VQLLKGCSNFVLKFGLEIRKGYGEIKVYTFGLGYFNGRGGEFRNGTGSVGHFRFTSGWVWFCRLVTLNYYAENRE